MFDLVLLICVEIILCFLAILVFSVNPKNKTNQYFSLWVFFLIVWIFSNYLENEPYFQNYRSLFLRIDFASAIFLGAFFYFFCLNFPWRVSLSWPKKAIIFTPSIILFILSFTNLIIKDIHFQDNTIVFKQSSLFLFYFLCFIFYIVRGCIELILRYKKSKGIERTQIFYVITGFSISAIMAVTLNLILPPLVFIPSNIARLGIYGILIFCIFSTIAITRHHLFGIKVILTEILVGCIAFILLIQAIIADNIKLKIFGFGLLALFSIAGFLLISSALKEIKYREELRIAKERAEKAYEVEKKSHEELKKLDEAKSQFVLITQHHLRTPLSIMKGYVSMLLEGSYGKMNEEFRKPLTGFQISTDNLIKLVNEFLDISQLQVGSQILSPQETQIEDLISEIIQELKPEADKKHIYLEIEKPTEPLPKVNIDRAKVKAALFNVIDNGMKYTPSGGVKVRFKTTDSKLKIIIQDTGIGMTKEDIDSLFTKFFSRGKEAKKVFATGRGIGLYMAERIIKAHQGRVWAESPGKDKGSIFYVELPIKL